MAIHFDPATGLTVDTTDVVREAVRQGWTSAFAQSVSTPLDTAASTPAGQLIDAETAEIASKDSAVLFFANQFDPYVAEGRWQDALGNIYFLTRKLDEPTIVTCQLTGLSGTVIPYGALVTAATGHALLCNRSVTIGEDSTAETTFRTVDTGPIEIPAHTVTSIVTTIPGWDTIDNDTAGVPGRDTESRAEYENRRAASVAANAHGSTEAIFGAIANITGVLDVQVLENIGPDPVVKYGVTVPGHGITVCIYGGEDEEIAEAIYRKKDNGADTGGNTAIRYTAADYHNAVYDYLIMRPDPIPFWIKVTVAAGIAPSDTQIATLKEALYRDFYGLNDMSRNARVGLAQTVYAARFYCPASRSGADLPIVSIEIALSDDQPADDGWLDLIDIRGDQEPTLSRDSILIVVAG